MKLILVRHGETVWNKEKKIQGITDVRLSENGYEQAKRLAVSLKNESLDIILSSPLQRAYDTAQLIGNYHNVPIKIENDLQELNAGEFEGLSYPYIRLRHPEFLARWKEDRASIKMPKGESLQEVQDRVWPVIQKLSTSSRHALVVSHSFVIITILCKLQNLNLSDSAQMRINVASKTCIEWVNGTARMILFNNTDHLIYP